MSVEFLAFGTVWFWLFLFSVFVAISYATDQDSPGIATVIAAMAVSTLVLLGGFNPLPWLSQNTGLSLLLVAGYLVIGAAWGFFKWGFWLRKTARRVGEVRAVHEKRMVLGLVGNRQTELRDALRARGLPTSFPVAVGDHKSSIIAWMTFWPASMTGTLLNDPVRLVYEEVYAWSSGVMQRMSDRTFATEVTLQEQATADATDKAAARERGGPWERRDF